MDIFHKIIKLSRWAGLIPIETNGNQFRFSKKAMVFILLQVVSVVISLEQLFRLILSPENNWELKIFQITVLVILDTSKNIFIIFFSFYFRFPKLKLFLRKFYKVTQDLGKLEDPVTLKYSFPLFMLLNILMTLNKMTGDQANQFYTVCYGIQIYQVVMLHIFMYVALSTVACSYKKINDDLRSLLIRRSNDLAVMIRQHLTHVHQRCFRAGQLYCAVRDDFGPDIFFNCLNFMLHLSFVIYATFSQPSDARITLARCLMVLKAIVITFYLAYIVDSIKGEKHTTEKLLVELLKERSCGVQNIEVRNSIKKFLLLVKSQPQDFSVCHHFNLSRAVVYDMFLGVITYVFVLIQFQGLKI